MNNHPKYGDDTKYCVNGPYYKTTDDRFQILIRIRNTRTQTSIPYARFLIECYLQRELESNEDVHHIDGNKLNDAIENLEVIKHGEHISQHKSFTPEIFKCVNCEKSFAKYGKQLTGLKLRQKNGKPGPFCSKSCAISWRNKYA